MNEKFDNEYYDTRFYMKLFNYLSEKHYKGLHWKRDYRGQENTGSYSWWVENSDLKGENLFTLQEVVEDIFGSIIYLAEHYLYEK